MQSSARSNTVDFSIIDSLDSIKHEYQTLHTELIKVRSERDELELKCAYLPSLLHTTSIYPAPQWSLKSPNWVQYEGPYSTSKHNMNVLIATTKKKSNVYVLNCLQFVSQAQFPYYTAFLVVVRVNLQETPNVIWIVSMISTMPSVKKPDGTIQVGFISKYYSTF